MKKRNVIIKKIIIIVVIIIFVDNVIILEFEVFIDGGVMFLIFFFNIKIYIKFIKLS